MERPLSAGREGMPEKGLVPLMEREEGNDAEDNALSGHHRVRMPASKRDEPVSKGGSGFGIAIEFKEDTECGALRVNAIKEGGPAWGKGILIGDIISRVDGAEVGHQPFSVVSSLIRGAKGSVVTIGFLRPKGGVDLNPTTIADPSATLPFEVKVRRDEPGAPADGTDGDDQGDQDDDDDSAVFGGEAIARGMKGLGNSTEVSIEARLRAHARSAVNAAAMTRKAILEAGSVRSSIAVPSHDGGRAGHNSMPMQGGASMIGSSREGRPHSMPAGMIGHNDTPSDVGSNARMKGRPTAAEMVHLAKEREKRIRDVRVRQRAMEAGPSHRASMGTSVPSTEGGPLSSVEIEKEDAKRHMERLSRSRTTLPYSAVKGYGDHSGWMREVEQKRAMSARNSANLQRTGSSTSSEHKNATPRYQTKQVVETSREKFERLERENNSSLMGELKDAALQCQKCCAAAF